jgi:hypothetical protein
MNYHQHALVMTKMQRKIFQILMYFKQNPPKDVKEILIMIKLQVN